ncbi:Aspartic protease PEP1 [Teratosphaeria destructans]|uniref:Aspartic protease PEP1 n=1 Tax=Teratosphaeria destructans TaxID=418781 RepID=A0A9W7SJQ3_9PEZI|nr:Aspartic protease PEP1 [Teratosphaeria destructans]
MPSIYSTIALLASAAHTFAAPKPGEGSSVPRIRTNATNEPIVKHYKVFQKYQVDAPAKVAAAVGGGKTGSISSNAQAYDAEYISPVTVGRNQLNLDFDTGSSDLWVFSTITPRYESFGHNLYDVRTGSREHGETWTIQYGDGSESSGIVYTDRVAVGGATVTRQAVEAATSVSSQFQSGASDGLLGLGYESGNTCSQNQCQTFFGNFQQYAKQPLFTADLQTHGGSYDFGYIDGSKYVGDISYVNVLQQRPSYWDFTAGAYYINGRHGGSIGYSVMDTGTSLWYLPSKAVAAFYRSIATATTLQGLHVFSCNDETVPDFSVDIGGQTFTVPASALSQEPLGDGSGYCVGSIQPNTGLPGSIFGDAFMKNFFVVFDLGDNQIGVANQ